MATFGALFGKFGLLFIPSSGHTGPYVGKYNIFLTHYIGSMSDVLKTCLTPDVSCRVVNKFAIFNDSFVIKIYNCFFCSIQRSKLFNDFIDFNTVITKYGFN